MFDLAEPNFASSPNLPRIGLIQLHVKLLFPIPDQSSARPEAKKNAVIDGLPSWGVILSGAFFYGSQGGLDLISDAVLAAGQGH